MTNALNEVGIEGTEEETLIQRIMERVRILMETHYWTIKGESKLREKAVLLRGQIRKQITEFLKRILELVEEDPNSKEAVAQARILNNETVEPQRLTLDKTALTLIIRKDMSDDDFKKDRDLRRERQERVNSALEKAVRWVDQIPALEDGTVLELSLLTSCDVPEVDEEYDNTIIKATIDQEEVETIERIFEEEKTRERDVSPEPEKHPGRKTSTPRQPAYSPPEKRRVFFNQSDRLNTIRQRRETRPSQQPGIEVGNGACNHPGYNPHLGELEGMRRGGILHLKPHEQEYYRLQNYYQTEVPLFPSGIDGSGSYRSIN